MSDYHESSADYYGDYDDMSHEYSCSVCGGPVFASFVSAAEMEGAMCSDCYEGETGEIAW